MTALIYTLIFFGAVMLGVSLGFFLCAVLSTSKTAEKDNEINRLITENKNLNNLLDQIREISDKWEA